MGCRAREGEQWEGHLVGVCYHPFFGPVLPIWAIWPPVHAWADSCILFLTVMRATLLSFPHHQAQHEESVSYSIRYFRIVVRRFNGSDLCDTRVCAMHKNFPSLILAHALYQILLAKSKRFLQLMLSCFRYVHVMHRVSGLLTLPPAQSL
jgi:hypothetical protein